MNTGACLKAIITEWWFLLMSGFVKKRDGGLCDFFWQKRKKLYSSDFVVKIC